MNPLRAVVKADLREGSCINADFYQRWYDIELECGHVVERRVRFPPQVGMYRRGFMAQYHPRPADEALPPPKRCRCGRCGYEARKKLG
jgi:hypothetical protein